MSSQQIPPTLCDIFADTLEIPREDVTSHLSAESTETWDSFRHLQLILSIEDEYGVQFDPQRIPELTTVARIEEALQQKGVKLK
jgi:acyl carrier protein